jgi:hypothetical protein
MPERVVDFLEVVQVDEQQAHVLVVSSSQSDRQIEVVQQRVTVGQARQLIVVRKTLRLLHGLRQGYCLPFAQPIALPHSIELP